MFLRVQRFLDSKAIHEEHEGGTKGTKKKTSVSMYSASMNQAFFVSFVPLFVFFVTRFLKVSGSNPRSSVFICGYGIRSTGACA